MNSQANSERALRKTAYHEAGHAVAAVFLGTSLDYVTILARNHEYGRSRGETRMNDLTAITAETQRNLWIGIFHDIIRAASARYSQAQFTRLSKADEAGFGSDEEPIDVLARMLFRKEDAAATQTSAVARSIAQKMMSSPHGKVAVHAVAHKLMAYRSLRGSEVVEIVQRSPFLHFQQGQKVEDMMFIWENKREPFTPSEFDDF